MLARPILWALSVGNNEIINLLTRIKNEPSYDATSWM
ncbi:MAG: hypothetical protein JO149_09980 [Gammaproteobacteria bacterium]|nr:hypothetical protein [Gammaproteobacteria bacterium]